MFSSGANGFPEYFLSAVDDSEVKFVDVKADCWGTAFEFCFISLTAMLENFDPSLGFTGVSLFGTRHIYFAWGSVILFIYFSRDIQISDAFIYTRTDQLQFHVAMGVI